MRQDKRKEQTIEGECRETHSSQEENANEIQDEAGGEVNEATQESGSFPLEVIGVLAVFGCVGVMLMDRRVFNYERVTWALHFIFWTQMLLVGCASVQPISLCCRFTNIAFVAWQPTERRKGFVFVRSVLAVLLAVLVKPNVVLCGLLVCSGFVSFLDALIRWDIHRVRLTPLIIGVWVVMIGFLIWKVDATVETLSLLEPRGWLLVHKPPGDIED